MMKSVYERTNLIITEFDSEDVIATSEEAPYVPPTPVVLEDELENAYRTFGSLSKGSFSWQ